MRDTRVHATLGTDQPVAASAREYLRGSLPAVYRDQPAGANGDAFVLRFLEALELVLDPAVATIDMLPAHLDIAIAPPEVIALVGEWLGIELDVALPVAAHRQLVRRATEISRLRGTLLGVALVLELSFRGREFEVSDSGSVIVSDGPSASQPAGPRTLTVRCPPRLDEDEMATVRRVVEEVKPAGVELELEPLGRKGDAA